MGRPSPNAVEARTGRAARRAAAVIFTTLAMTLMLVSPAHADTAPEGSTPATVSTDALSTPQIDGVVWAQAVLGNTVYVGGSFATARPAGSAAGVNTVVRSNLLAFDVTTGSLLSWAPTTNGAVKGLAVSADHTRVFVVGEFTKVNGSTRSRIASVSATTGALQSAFKPSVNGAINAVSVGRTSVYVTGAFTTAAGKSRKYAAGFNGDTGKLLGFAPKLSSRGLSIVTDTAVKYAVIGGMFTTVNGKTQRGSVKVDTSTGTKNQTWKLNSVVGNSTTTTANGSGAGIFSLTSDGTYVYGTGYSYKPKGSGPRLEGAFVASWSNGSIRWIEDCHGDSYSIAATASVVYVAGHPHYCGNIGGFPSTNPSTYQRGLAFTQAATGTVATNTGGSGYSDFGGNKAPTLLTWYPDFNFGTYTGQFQGPWSVVVAGDYVVYAGEFTKVNGKAQQGIVRFATSSIAPNQDGPQLTGAGFVPTVQALATGVSISWTANYDRDNQYLVYSLYRGDTLIDTVTVGSRIWYDRPTTTFVDLGGASGDQYHLVATDPFGNSATGGVVTVP